MCGIIGYFAFDERGIDKGGLECGLDKLRNRGPNDLGVHDDHHVMLGHARLSIIDIAGNQQPLQSPCGRYVIVYNGEIYNYRNLERHLISIGRVPFKSNDTSVLLELYAAYGEKCLDRLNGMFAFAIWDRKERSLFMARDRMGEKPLFYSLTKHGIYFASTIPSLLEFNVIDKKYDQKSIDQFLAYQFINDGTVYENIKKVTPAHFLKVSSDRSCQLQAYWKLVKSDAYSDTSKSEVLTSVRELVYDAVKIRLESEVPLGVFLSGGIDSTIITSILSGEIDRVKSFSVGFDEPSYDESQYAAIASNKFKTDHQALSLPLDSSSLESVLLDVSSSVGEPFADPAIVPTWHLSKFAAADVRVALAGDGADEIFGGYSRYRAGQYFSTKLGGVLPAQLYSMVANILPRTDAYYGTSLRKKLKLLHRYSIGQKSGFIPRVFLNQELIELGRQPLEDQSRVVSCSENNTVLQQHQFSDLSNYLPNNIMVKTDRASMNFGLEVRSPFLDHRLVELGYGLKDHFKIAGSKQKTILRSAFEQDIGPEITRRGKHGFASPLAFWLKGPLQNMLQDSLSSRVLGEFIDLGVYRKMCSDFLNYKAENEYRIWVILMLYVWLRVVRNG